MKYSNASLLGMCFSVFVCQAQVNEVEQDSLGINTEMQEVIIQSLRKKQYVDRAVYTFSQEDLEKARYAKDLLITLPSLMFDPLSNTVQSIKPGKTLFLINGVEATDNQMRSIIPANVKRVEYYDIPPTRWANVANQVVNIITQNPENGYVYGVDVLGAFDTGFLNGSAYTNVTRGKHNLAFNYSINLRDYNNREVNAATSYALNGSDYRTDEWQRDKFGYTNQDIALIYTNADTDKYTFQAKFNVNLLEYFNYTNGSILFAKDSDLENHTNYKHNTQKFNKPSLDLYYSKKLSEKDELIFNAVGTYFTSRTFDLDREWLTNTTQFVFDNETNLETTQSGIVGEVAYSRTIGTSKLNAGYQASIDNVDYDLTNLEGYSNYTTKFLQQYMYAEFAGKKNGWLYRLGAGLTNLYNSSPEHTQDTWVFTPKVVLGYDISNTQSIRLSSSYKPTALSSDQVSSNVIQLRPNIVKTGNPYLDVQRSFKNTLNYSFNSKYFDMNASLSYDYTKDFVSSRYVLDNNRYAFTYVNDAHMQEYEVDVYGSVKPFGSSILELKVNLYPTWQSLETESGDKITNNYIGNSFTVASKYNNWYFQYSFNIPVYSLSGTFLNTGENRSNLYGMYKLDNWSFSAGMLFLGMPAEYKSKSLKESLVQSNSVTQIWNNKNMFVLGVSYDFAVGKRTNAKKSLQNYTKGAVTF